MEEKLFWVSLVCGAFAFLFKWFARSPVRLASSARVGAVHLSFWGAVGAMFGVLFSSYLERPELLWPLSLSLASTGLFTAAAWQTRGGTPPPQWGALWAGQGVSVGISLGFLQGGLAVAMHMLLAVGLGVLAALGGAAGARRPGFLPVAVQSVFALEGVVFGVVFFGAGGWSATSLLLVAGAAVFFFQQGTAWTYSPKRAAGGIDLVRYDHEWADTGFSAILLASIIMYLLLQAFKIPSGSMHLTLIEGDHLFVNKFLYGVRIPYTAKRLLRVRDVRRGDVVVFRFPTEDRHSPHYGKDFIKRAVGLPGDVIEIRDKTVFVNGVRSEESYVHLADPEIIRPLPLVRSTEAFQSLWADGMIAPRFGDNYRDNFGPVTVPAGTYFVMGDNRDRSYDSRFWGPMPLRNLKGKAWILYWPLSRRKIIT